MKRRDEKRREEQRKEKKRREEKGRERKEKEEKKRNEETRRIEKIREDKTREKQKSRMFFIKLSLPYGLDIPTAVLSSTTTNPSLSARSRISSAYG